MANINKIRLSGQTYDIQDPNASKTVELTQAQYDALTVKDPNTFYIITDAQGADLSNYYTKSETSGATQISTALASKQTTLTAGTNITIVDNVISATGGGGGSSYTAGDGIDITNDVISVTGKVDTSTYNTYTAATDTALSGKQDRSKLPQNIAANVTYDKSTKNLSVEEKSPSNGGIFYSNISVITINNLDIFSNNPNINLSLVETSAITTSVTSASTDSQVPSAKAVNDKLGGLSIVKLTESEYAALVTKDSNTLYCVVPDPSN